MNCHLCLGSLRCSSREDISIVIVKSKPLIGGKGKRKEHRCVCRRSCPFRDARRVARATGRGRLHLENHGAAHRPGLAGRADRQAHGIRESLQEDDILGAIGSLCSVATTGFGDEAAKEKALTAARLALATIALLWQTPSKALSGFNLLFDRSVRRLKTLTFVPKNHVLSGSSLSHMPNGADSGEGGQCLRFKADSITVIADTCSHRRFQRSQVAVFSSSPRLVI